MVSPDKSRGESFTLHWLHKATKSLLKEFKSSAKGAGVAISDSEYVTKQLESALRLIKTWMENKSHSSSKTKQWVDNWAKHTMRQVKLASPAKGVHGAKAEIYFLALASQRLLQHFSTFVRANRLGEHERRWAQQILKHLKKAHDRLVRMTQTLVSSPRRRTVSLRRSGSPQSPAVLSVLFTSPSRKSASPFKKSSPRKSPVSSPSSFTKAFHAQHSPSVRYSHESQLPYVTRRRRSNFVMSVI